MFLNKRFLTHHLSGCFCQLWKENLLVTLSNLTSPLIHLHPSVYHKMLLSKKMFPLEFHWYPLFDTLKTILDSWLNFFHPQSNPNNICIAFWLALKHAIWLWMLSVILSNIATTIALDVVVDGLMIYCKNSTCCTNKYSMYPWALLSLAKNRVINILNILCFIVHIGDYAAF